MSKELEKAGIPTAHITAMTPVAMGVGSIRVIQGKEIVSPLGNARMESFAEKEMRLGLVNKALEALQTKVTEPTLFQSTDKITSDNGKE
jgi:glycine reductase